MNIAFSNAQDKISCKLHEEVERLIGLVQQGASDACSFDAIERSVLDSVLAMGHSAMEGFLRLPGAGDLGEEATDDDGRTLYCSDEPVQRTIRSVFGEHCFYAYVYSPGPKMRIGMRPIDARMQLPEGQQSYLYQEFSQLLCVEQAFGQAGRSFSALFKQNTSVDTFEKINQQMGEQAEQFLDNLPPPPADQEAQLLIMTADGKGIPLVQADTKRVSITDEKPKRPGNRKMATLAGVYTVDPFLRTPEQIVEALFKDYEDEKPPKRPPSMFKHVVGKLPTPEGEIPASSETLAIKRWRSVGPPIKCPIVGKTDKR